MIEIKEKNPNRIKSVFEQIHKEEIECVNELEIRAELLNLVQKLIEKHGYHGSNKMTYLPLNYLKFISKDQSSFTNVTVEQLLLILGKFGIKVNVSFEYR